MQSQHDFASAPPLDAQARLDDFEKMSQQTMALQRYFPLGVPNCSGAHELVETFCLTDGQILRWDYHLARVSAACRLLGWNDVGGALHAALLTALRSPQQLPAQGRVKGRCVYDNAGLRSLTFAPYVPRAVQTLQLVEADALSYPLKSTDRRALEACFAQRNGADDVLIVRGGRLTDTSIANVALWHAEQQQWFTPERPLLCGTHRAALLHHRTIVPDARLSLERLSEFSRIRLFNAMLRWGEIDLPLSVLRGA